MKQIMMIVLATFAFSLLSIEVTEAAYLSQYESNTKKVYVNGSETITISERISERDGYRTNTITTTVQGPGYSYSTTESVDRNGRKTVKKTSSDNRGNGGYSKYPSSNKNLDIIYGILGELLNR